MLLSLTQLARLKLSLLDFVLSQLLDSQVVIELQNKPQRRIFALMAANDSVDSVKVGQFVALVRGTGYRLAMFRTGVIGV